MKNITFGWIDSGALSDEFYGALYNLSNMKNDESCWSFVVRTDWLCGWLKDMDTDAQAGHPYPAYHQQFAG